MKKVDLNAPVVRKDLDEAVEAILVGVDNMFSSPDNPIAKRLDRVEERLENVEVELKNTKAELKDDINGLKAEFSQQVSRREFNNLKSRVDRHLAAS